MELKKELYARLLPCALALATAFTGAAHAAETVSLKDTPYPGTLTLAVDLRDAPRKIFTAHETIPVSPGNLTLRYPKWIPGEHAPSGTLIGVTAMQIKADGKALAWRRELADMFAIDVQVPAGVKELTVDFDFLSPTGGGDFGQSASTTPHLAELEWNQVLFYPAGYNVSRIPVAANVRVPQGWQFASALEHEADGADGTHFKTVSVEQLVDSPLFTGEYFRRFDLTDAGQVPVHLNLIGDRPANLELRPEQVNQHKALVKEAVAMFGAQHYAHYDFLLAVSDSTGSFGLEHHQSSDDRIDADFFTDPELYLTGVGLLPHEYVHSWNGKFRRPTGLATPDYTLPMKGDLLWVYEGLTQYLGDVLTARSGMWNAEQYRDNLAVVAAIMDHVPGRTWRPLQDTADAAQLLYYQPGAWTAERRSVDYYPEGELLWLDVDTRIRELSGGKRTLDDFLHAFHGTENGVVAVRSYGFDDVVKALEAVQPNDWRGFLRQRLDSRDAGAPLNGLRQGGWKLVYNSTPTPMARAIDRAHKWLDRSLSIGLTVANDDNRGTLADVLWGGPAFNAGLIPGMKIVAVNGEAYTPENFDAAIADAAKSKKPIELLVRNINTFLTVRIPYFGGQVYPHLERADGEDRLSEIVKAKG